MARSGVIAWDDGEQSCARAAFGLTRLELRPGGVGMKGLNGVKGLKGVNGLVVLIESDLYIDQPLIR